MLSHSMPCLRIVAVRDKAKPYAATQHQSANAWLPIKPLSKTGAELLFRLISQHYERGATIITSDLPFDEWTGTFFEERLSSAFLDRLTHHVHTLEMNGQSYRLAQCRSKRKC